MDWQEVAIDGERHMSRMRDMYEELGFEVRLEEIQPERCKQCTECFRERGEKLYRIYARREQEAEESK